MAFPFYLAMTNAEYSTLEEKPPFCAWMACHFSPYGLGLSNLPQRLPPHALLLLDDITPIREHDPQRITEQLLNCLESLNCHGVLLDFQRPDVPETAVLVNHLTQTLPCPVIVSESYASELSCPVFLPPVPPSVALEEYISPWEGRSIWMEIGLTGELLTLTDQGCETVPLPFPNEASEGFPEKALHCHYRIETNEKSARFTLWRTEKDLAALLEEAEGLGISGAVGLYQEFSKFQIFL